MKRFENSNFPLFPYNKKAEIVKPLDQRLHVKKGIPIRKDVNQISSPELQLILDFDWWSPNKNVAENSPYNGPNPASARVVAAPTAPSGGVAPRPRPVPKPCPYPPAGPPVVAASPGVQIKESHCSVSLEAKV
jgi:hypothetical protein